MELKHLLLACYNVFDPRFVWQKERYIERLFAFYSSPVMKIVRHEAGVVLGEGENEGGGREEGGRVLTLRLLHVPLQVLHPDLG